MEQIKGRKGNYCRSPVNLLYHIATDSTQLYNDFFSLTTQNPSLSMYVLLELIRPHLNNMISYFGHSLLGNVRGESTTAIA